MLTAQSLAVALLAALTLAPLLRHPHWLIRGLDFPRLQLALAALALLAAQAVWLDLGRPGAWLLPAVTLLCLGWQAWWILPYTRLWPVEVKRTQTSDQRRRLRLLTANVLMTNRNAPALLELVRLHKPDLLITLEGDAWWQAQLDTLLPELPHNIRCAQDNLYGMHVYSKLPLEAPEIRHLVEPGKPSIHARMLLGCGARVSLHVLHPAPPSPSENATSEERDAELVIVARSVAERAHEPTLVAGDLNDVAWSRTTRLFRKISGLLDPRVGRGMFNTFHAKVPLLRWPLDHLFHSAHFTLGQVERLPAIGSDHFPLLAELWFTPADGAGQDGIDADADDRAHAAAKAARQDASAQQVPSP